MRAALAAASALFVMLALPAAARLPDPGIADQVMKLTRATVWTPAAPIRLRFPAFHPQGMVRIGEHFYLSAVEITRRPQKLKPPAGGYDRDTGAGVGHLFKIGPDGALLADLVLGEGAIYHPGGIDFDGTAIWVPVSEYRPNGRSIVYRVDPETMKSTEIFRFADHLGGIVHDPQTDRLHAVSWGSRLFYSWALGTDGGLTAAPPVRAANPSHYIDYQDCHHVADRRMLCGGIAEYPTGPLTTAFPLGGIDLIDLRDGRPLWQAPIALCSPTGRAMTQNAFFVEATPTGLRTYFTPDDDDATIYLFDAALP